jgi:DNA processing protein
MGEMSFLDEKNAMYLLALHRAMNITLSRWKKIKKFFATDLQKAYQANISELQAADLDAPAIEKLVAERSNISPQKEYDLLQKCGAGILLYGEKDYPLSLESISSPPAILFVRGTLSACDVPSLSVVGSRNISSYGRRVVEKIVREFAMQKITIVSGLALGTDILAHKFALEGGTRTIGILGNGIDKICPTQNRSIGEQILQQKKGAILSEYLPQTEARPEYFPIRNRLIAGISRATIIIEAAEKSGSLITAQMAVDQGREVFAVPGEIFSRNSVGTNKLILSGSASPALSGIEILEYLGIERHLSQKQKPIPCTGIEADILRLFGVEEKLHINDLIRKATVPGSVVSSNIALMEMKGLVRHLGGQMYAKNV